jgi:hypothetical protein
MPRRAERWRLLLVGALAGVSLALGSLVSEYDVLAVGTIFVLGVVAAWVTARSPLGQVLLAFSVPLVGVGLSFNVSKGAAVAGLILAGTLYAWLVSLCWPERPEPSVHPPLPDESAMVDYGIRFGLAGATAAALGFAFGIDHVGWQVAAALFVMRPAADMQQLRSVGRVASVTVGALVAAGMASASPDVVWYSLAVAAVLTLASATRPSRWYITPAFTTFLVISLMLYGHPQDTAYRFNQRVLETLVGVAVAYVFGLLLPALRSRLRASTHKRTSP